MAKRKRSKARNTAQRLSALERLLKDKRPRSTLELAAIERQLRDLEEGHKRGLVWDEAAASRAVAFFSLLQHWKGRQWAGKTFLLEPWQEHCIVAPLFGWKIEGGLVLLRRFRVAYIEIPRKNGKTTLAAGIALQGLTADDEPGAEVYAGATTKPQASILFRDVIRCRGQALKKLTKERGGSLEFTRNGSFFRPVPAKAENLDGLNGSRIIVDELHAHKSRDLWDVLLDSTGARLQPLSVAITTAGADRTSICWEVRELVRSMLEGAPDHDDSLFGFVACAEDKDDWESPETWWKANPNMRVSVTEESLAHQAKLARASGSAESNFRRKRLDQWVGRFSRWIDPAVWAEGRSKLPREKFLEGLKDQECFAGFDQGGRDDFAAAGLVFPERIKLEPPTTPEAVADTIEKLSSPLPMATSRCKIRRARVLTHCWIAEHGRRDVTKAPLANWIRDGFVTVTPGNATDHDAILRWLEEAQKTFRLRELAFDGNNARQFGIDAQKLGIPIFEFWQTKRNYNEPCVAFEGLAANGLIEHDGNGLLHWQIGNVVMEADARGYVMPAKHKSSEKIDAVVALLMGFARALFTDLDAGDSVYLRRGMIIL